MVHFPKNEIHFTKSETSRIPNESKAVPTWYWMNIWLLLPAAWKKWTGLKKSLSCRRWEAQTIEAIFTYIPASEIFEPFSTHSAIKTSLSARQILIPWGFSADRIVSMARILSASLAISAEVISNVQPKESPPSNRDSFQNLQRAFPETLRPFQR